MTEQIPQSGSADMLAMYVLDVMRYDDTENVSSIVNMLNDYETIGWRDHWPQDFTRDEVVHALVQLLSRKMVRVLEYDSAKSRLVDTDASPDFVDDDNTWFRLTELGWSALRNWTPPSDS